MLWVSWRRSIPGHHHHWAVTTSSQHGVSLISINMQHSISLRLASRHCKEMSSTEETSLRTLLFKTPQLSLLHMALVWLSVRICMYVCMYVCMYNLTIQQAVTQVFETMRRNRAARGGDLTGMNNRSHHWCYWWLNDVGASGRLGWTIYYISAYVSHYIWSHSGAARPTRRNNDRGNRGLWTDDQARK